MKDKVEGLRCRVWHTLFLIPHFLFLIPLNSLLPKPYAFYPKPLKKVLILTLCLWPCEKLFCWGFYMHQQINYHAVFLLPPEMLILFKPNIEFLREHAVDPDK